MSTSTQVVKKFINDPEDVVPEALAGIGSRPSRAWYESTSRTA